MALLPVKTATRKFLAINLAFCFAFAPAACTKKSKGNRGSEGATTEQADKLNLASEMVNHVETSLQEGGLSAPQAAAVGDGVRQSGALVLESSVGLLLSFMLEDEGIDTVGPNVTGAFIDALDTPGAELDDETRNLALGIVVSAGFEFVGTQSLDSENQRSEVLSNMTDRAVSSLPNAGFSEDAGVNAVGTIATTAIGGMVAAQVTSDNFLTTTKKLTTKIGTAMGRTGIPDARLDQALTWAAKKAGEAVGGLPIANVLDGLEPATDGLMTGLNQSTLPKNVRLAVIDKIPEGFTAALPGLVNAGKIGIDQMSGAVSRVASIGMSAFVASSSDVTADEMATYLPNIVGGPVRAIAYSGIPESDIILYGMATAPMDAMMANMDTAFSGVFTTANARLAMVENSLARTMTAVGSNNNDAFLGAIAPAVVTRSFDIAATNSQKFGLQATSGEMIGLYQGMFNGAFAGLATTSVSQSVLPNILSATMDGAINSVGTLYGNQLTSGAIDSAFLTNIAAVASQSVGTKFAAVLPPADLNVAFATVTSQYMQGVNSFVTRNSFNTSTVELAKNISTQSLTSFAGAWNANPSEIQSASMAMTGLIGQSGSTMDAKIIASIQGATQEVVVNAVTILAGGSMPSCATELPDSTSDSTFETTLNQRPGLVACSKGGGSCPMARQTSLYKYNWSVDPFGNTCFLYKEMQLSGTAGLCAAGQRYVYGIGCQSDAASCSGDQYYVYGIGCQAKSFFCPVGQHFVDGIGCQNDSVSYFCSPGTHWEPLLGCRPDNTMCAYGYQYVAGSGCQLLSTSAPIQCPVGFHYVNAMCEPDTMVGQCPIGRIWNGTSCIANTPTDACTGGRTWNTAISMCQCPAGMSWDNYTMVCLASTQPTCPGGQVWSTSLYTCVCASGYYWDPMTYMCMASGGSTPTCSGGRVWDPALAQCICPSGYYWDSVSNLCQSTTTSPQYNCSYSGGYWDYGTAMCVCPTGYTWNSNYCAANSGSGGSTNTSQNNCTADGGYWLTGSSTCDCTQIGKVWDNATLHCIVSGGGGGSTAQNNCTTDGGTWLTGSSTCDCAPIGKIWDNATMHCIVSGGSQAQTNCQNESGTWNGTSCTCQSGYNWDGLHCVAASTGQANCTAQSGVWYAAGNWCYCNIGQMWNNATNNCVAASCADGSQHFNGQTCVNNECSPGRQWNPSMRMCEPICTAPQTHWAGSSCVSDACSAGYHWDKTYISPPLPGPPGTAYGACVKDCSPGYHWDGNMSCVADTPSPCVSGMHWDFVEAICKSDLPGCGSNMHFNGSMCASDMCGPNLHWDMPTKYCIPNGS